MEHATVHDFIISLKIVKSVLKQGLVVVLIRQELLIVPYGHIEVLAVHVVVVHLDGEAIRAAQVILQINFQILFACKLLRLEEVLLARKHLTVEDVVDGRGVISNEANHCRVGFNARLSKVERP